MRRWWCAAGGLGRRVLVVLLLRRRRLPCPSAAATLDPQVALFHRPFLLVLPPAPLPSTRLYPRGSSTRPSLPSFRPPSAYQQQVRHYAKKERSRAPLTPTKSKVKKYKMKAPSSMKFRFRTMNDGQVRRWRAGKRHNAHLKSKEAKRRLRKPALVHLAYAKVIKKLNFCGRNEGRYCGLWHGY